MWSVSVLLLIFFVIRWCRLIVICLWWLRFCVLIFLIFVRWLGLWYVCNLILGWFGLMMRLVLVFVGCVLSWVCLMLGLIVNGWWFVICLMGLLMYWILWWNEGLLFF